MQSIILGGKQLLEPGKGGRLGISAAPLATFMQIVAKFVEPNA